MTHNQANLASRSVPSTPHAPKLSNIGLSKTTIQATKQSLVGQSPIAETKASLGLKPQERLTAPNGSTNTSTRTASDVYARSNNLNTHVDNVARYTEQSLTLQDAKDTTQNQVKDAQQVVRAQAALKGKEARDAQKTTVNSQQQKDQNEENWSVHKNQEPIHSREWRGLLEQRGRPTEKVTSNSMVPKPRQRVNDGSSPGRTTHVKVFVNNQGQKKCSVEYICPQTGKVKNANVAYNNKKLPVFDDYAVFTAKFNPQTSYNQKLSPETIHRNQMVDATKELSAYLKEYPRYAQNYRPDQLKAIHKYAHKIPGLTWHHNGESKPRNMQLLPENLHDIVKHNGTKSQDKWK